jgi:hypothetical protein
VTLAQVDLPDAIGGYSTLARDRRHEVTGFHAVARPDRHE